jgi:hypothetical protein
LGTLAIVVATGTIAHLGLCHLFPTVHNSFLRFGMPSPPSVAEQSIGTGAADHADENG